MLDLFWNLYQQRQIADLRSEVSRARHSDASSRDRRIDELERRVDLVALTTMAMWALVRSHLGVTDADLETAMTSLDLSDGVADGKVNRPRHCPSCSRVITKRLSRCIYCGTDVGAQL